MVHSYYGRIYSLQNRWIYKIRISRSTHFLAKFHGLEIEISINQNHKSIDIYTSAINVQNAICAGGFETRKSAFFNFTVTIYSTPRKNCDCNFSTVHRRPPPPVPKTDIFMDIYTFGDIYTFFGDHTINHT